MIAVKPKQTRVYMEMSADRVTVRKLPDHLSLMETDDATQITKGGLKTTTFKVGQMRVTYSQPVSKPRKKMTYLEMKKLLAASGMRI